VKYICSIPAGSRTAVHQGSDGKRTMRRGVKSKAILVLLSLGCFQKVGEMLHRWALLFLLHFLYSHIQCSMLPIHPS